MVQISGAFVPQARSSPWQEVIPQDELPDEPVARVVGGRGGTALVPDDTEAQPAIPMAAARRTRQIRGIPMGHFMAYHAMLSGDITYID
jgi:hypothetical protein